MTFPANSFGSFKVHPSMESWIQALPLGSEAYMVFMIEVEGVLRAGAMKLDGVLEGPSDIEALQIVAESQIGHLSFAERGHIVAIAFTQEHGTEVSHEVSVTTFGDWNGKVPLWAPRSKADLFRQMR